MQNKISFHWIGASVAGVTTLIVGLLPTWIYHIVWNIIPHTPAWKYPMLTVAVIVLIVAQIIWWIVVCLFWDDSIDPMLAPLRRFLENYSLRLFCLWLIGLLWFVLLKWPV